MRRPSSKIYTCKPRGTQNSHKNASKNKTKKPREFCCLFPPFVLLFSYFSKMLSSTVSKGVNTMDANSNVPLQRVHRHVAERIVTFLTVPQRACARRASKALWKAVSAASMEDLLRATVFEKRDLDAQLVVVAMSRTVVSFPSADALVAWSGGLGPLYEELPLRFPHAAAIGISAQLAAVHPFPFASGPSVTTMCIVTAVAPAPSPEHAIESIVLGVRNTASVLVRVLSHKNTACPIVCLEGATPEQFPHMAQSVPLSSLPPIRSIEGRAFYKSQFLHSIDLAHLPLLESIGDEAFSECAHLARVDLCELSSLRSIGKGAFWNCESLEHVQLRNLSLESIGGDAFCGCVHLCSVSLAGLPSLRSIGARAFCECESLQSIRLANLPLLDRIAEEAFSGCVSLLTLDILELPSLRSIGERAFCECKSLQSIRLANLPLIESFGIGAFSWCARLSSLDISALPIVAQLR